MATKRKDGRWQEPIEIGYEGGKRKRKFVYGKTKKEAERKARTLRVKREQGYNIHPQRQTVAQYLQQWLGDVVALHNRPTTLEMYSHSVRRITRHLGHIIVPELTRQQVQGAWRAMLKEGYAPATVERAYDVLCVALAPVVEDGTLVRNVAKLTKPPQVEPYQARTLNVDEMRRLLAAAADHRYLGLACRFGVFGLRKGEVLGLGWLACDLDRGVFRVVQNLQLIKGKLELLPPKTKRSRRLLPLFPSQIAMLRNHRVRQLEDRRIAGVRWQEYDLVFCTSNGTPIAPRNFLRDWHALLKRAGRPPMRFHDLRHSLSSFLAMIPDKVHPKTVQAILGHSDITTTLNIYTQLPDTMVIEALREVEDLFDTGRD